MGELSTTDGAFELGLDAALEFLMLSQIPLILVASSAIADERFLHIARFVTSHRYLDQRLHQEMEIFAFTYGEGKKR